MPHFLLTLLSYRIDFATEVFLATTFVLPSFITSTMDNRNQGSLYILISKMDENV